MRIKLIGIGQCGSFVVYDVLAFLFDTVSSKELKSMKRYGSWTKIFGFTEGGRRVLTKFSLNVKKVFRGDKVSEFPLFYVVDGNSNNVLVDGLSKVKKNAMELDVQINSFELSTRDKGCSIGQLGEYYFTKETELNQGIFHQINNVNYDTEANIVIFATGGGSGSGGSLVFGKFLKSVDTNLLNIMVLPSVSITSHRQKWNTGRCLHRIKMTRNHNAALIVSNLSEDPTEQYAINEYIRTLIIRLSNFGYPGNVPKIGTDLDPMDLKVFFSRRAAFVGMSSVRNDDPDKKAINALVDKALKARSQGATEGLSIELTKTNEKAILENVNKILVVVGIPFGFNSETKVEISELIKTKIANRLRTDRSKIDCEINSYGSTNLLELTIFFRIKSFISNPVTASFIDFYQQWYKDESTEYEYLKNHDDGDTYVSEIYEILSEEIESNSEEVVQNFFTNKMTRLQPPS